MRNLVYYESMNITLIDCQPCQYHLKWYEVQLYLKKLFVKEKSSVDVEMHIPIISHNHSIEFKNHFANFNGETLVLNKTKSKSPS